MKQQTLKHPDQDHPTSGDVLRHHMAETFAVRNMPSGSKSIILTPGQLARLEVLTRGSDNPTDEGLRLLLDLDDLPAPRIIPGQRV